MSTLARELAQIAVQRALSREARIIPGIVLRDKQIIPSDGWLIYLIMTGRGWGKTLVGAYETIKRSRTCSRLAIVAADFADGRDICVEGETGIKTLCPDVQFNRSLGELHFPSGARGKLFSAEDPESLRGPNNYFAWGDEFGKWKYQKQTWEQLMMTMRKGTAQTLLTTTPRPTPLIKEIIARPTTITVQGSSRENLDNLSPAFIENVLKPYEGTHLGQQEIEGILLAANEGVVYPEFSELHHKTSLIPPHFVRVIAAVDWGFVHPGVIQVIGETGDGRLYLIHEEYKRQRGIDEWVTVAVQLRNIWNIKVFYCDPSEPDYIDKFFQAGLTAHSANNTVSTGIQAVKRRLAVRSDGQPGLLIYPGAVWTFAEFEQYVWASKGGEYRDEPLKANDHAMDALRYGIMAIDHPDRVPIVVEVKQYV